MRLVCKLTESHKTISGDLVAFDCDGHLLYIFQQMHAMTWKAFSGKRETERKRATERNRSMVNSGRLEGFCFCAFHHITSGQQNSCLGFSWEISLTPTNHISMAYSSKVKLGKGLLGGVWKWEKPPSITLSLVRMWLARSYLYLMKTHQAGGVSKLSDLYPVQTDWLAWRYTVVSVNDLWESVIWVNPTGPRVSSSYRFETEQSRHKYRPLKVWSHMSLRTSKGVF